MEKIELFCIKKCWGNFAFDYAYSASVGNSGGILCVWDPTAFKKINVTVSDYCVIIRGTWVSNGKNLLIISVYAPQELTEKRCCGIIIPRDGELEWRGDYNGAFP
ncbi:hypothetical protein Tco_1194332 [Tanacetum coccineum]